MEGGGIVRPLHNIKEDNNNKTRGKVDVGKEGQTQRGSKRIFVAGVFWSHRGVMCWTGFGPGKVLHMFNRLSPETRLIALVPLPGLAFKCGFNALQMAHGDELEEEVG